MRHNSEFRKKNKIKKRLYSIPVLILLFLVLGFLVKGTFNVYQRASISKEKLLVAQANIEELNERQESISNKINKLNTSTGIEEEIREKFNVVKSGEEMIVIINKNSEEDEDINNKKESFWKTFFPWMK